MGQVVSLSPGAMRDLRGGPADAQHISRRPDPPTERPPTRPFPLPSFLDRGVGVC